MGGFARELGAFERSMARRSNHARRFGLLLDRRASLLAQESPTDHGARTEQRCGWSGRGLASTSSSGGHARA